MEKKPVLKTSASGNGKKKEKAMYIPKPFLRGKPWDSLCMRAVLAMMGSYVLLMIAFLLMGVMMIIGNAIIRIALNAALLLGSYLVFYSFGMGSGTQAVGQGEILHNRLERGESLHKGEQDCCYHPLKGFLVGLIGTLPVLICGMILAFVAHRQMTGFGALPAWVDALSGHEEVNGPLAYYAISTGLGLEDMMRIVVRISIMPWVNIFDSTNMDAMLTLERVAPIIIALPALFYGVGYTRGPRNRARVHGDIAMGKKKAAKKARREHKRKVEARKPQQLN